MALHISESEVRAVLTMPMAIGMVSTARTSDSLICSAIFRFSFRVAAQFYLRNRRERTQLLERIILQAGRSVERVRIASLSRNLRGCAGRSSASADRPALLYSRPSRESEIRDRPSGFFQSGPGAGHTRRFR